MNLRSSLTGSVESPEARDNSRSETHLQGGWLVTVRIVWVVVSLLAVGLFVASLPSYFAFLHVPGASSFAAPLLTASDVETLRGLGLSLDLYAWLDIGVYVAILLAYVLVGAVLFWRKSDDRMALLASLSLVLFPVAFSSNVLGTLPAAWTLPVEIVELLGNVCLGFFFAIFPNGQFIPRWTGWLMVVWVAYWFVSIFFPDSALANSWLFLFPLPVGALCLIALQVYHYRRVSTPVQRQQTKWVVAGFAFSFGPLVIAITIDFSLLVQLFPKSALVITLIQWPFDLLLLLFPLSLGFAILRYRLWDIGVLINRTLVYGTLTISLGLIYAGLVIGSQALLRGFIGQTSDVAIVISTLVIAALFHPLRRGLQNLIDRRFYRHNYNAAKILSAFSATLRNEVDLATLSEQLVTVVEETMQPAHVSLWLRKAEQEEKRRI